MVMRNAASRVYARNPLVVSGTDVLETWRTTQLLALSPRHVLDLGNVSIADDDVRFAFQQRLEQRRDLAARILVVGVGIDDEVGAALERCVDAGGEGSGEPFVAPQPNDVIDAGGARDIRSTIPRPVVDDEDFDDVDAGDGSREFRQGGRQRLCLVEARDLDDELVQQQT